MASSRRGQIIPLQVSLALLLAACTTMGNTLAQDLAWQRWEKCRDVPTINLKEIMPDGGIWFYARESSAMAAAKECLERAAAEQAQRTAVKPPEPAAVASPQVARAQPPVVSGPPVAPVWKVGDEWAFRWESPQGKGTFVWSVDRVDILDGVEFYVIKSGTAREIYWRKADLAYHMDKVGRTVEIRYVPPRNMYAWPLSPGKTWENKYTREAPPDRQTFEFVEACQVNGEENITVPVGAFRTLKITCRNQGTGSITFEAWYSPEVKHYIKIKSRFSYGIQERELIGFKLK